VIPIRDENPTELRPVVTVLLIVLNLLAWFQLQGAGMTEQALEASVVAFGTRPCELTGACPVQGLGWETILTSMFMHGSWSHLLGNMLFLWVFGNNIEDSMGHVRFLLFYLLCGVAAGLAHVYMGPGSQIPAVGASGAISGIMGAYVVLYPRARVQTWVPPIFVFNLPAFLFLGYWFFLQLLMGAADRANAVPGEPEMGGVAVWAHVGGFVAGVLLVKVFENRTLVRARKAGIVLSREEVARSGGGW
jgi:membrane associated rhomboid family serine protease